jgi:hypothetical protein
MPKPKKSTPPSSPQSSDASSPDSTPEKKVSYSKAFTIALKAEKETKAIAANYQLVKSVTDNFVKLGISNYEIWRRSWEQELKTLGWSATYMSIDGPELDLNAEVNTEYVHRNNAAKMVLRTIDAVEHEPWLRDTDPTNPQAIFRRIHLKFRGTDTIAVSSQIESQLLTMTMKTTRLDVVSYGSAIVENLRKLREMGTPMCEIKMVSLYLLGLNRVFDHVRFDIQRMIKNKKSKAPKTMAAARKMVEDWAVQMKDRGLITFKDTSGADPMSPILTMLGEEETISTMEPSTATESTNKDFSSFMCTECNVTGHSSKWGGCPTKVAKKAGAAFVMHLLTDTPAPTTSTIECSLRGYSEKLLNILLNVLSTDGGNTPAANSPKDIAAIMMRAFDENSGTGR